MRRAFAVLVLALLAGCASLPANPPLAAWRPEAGYRFELLDKGGEAQDRLFVVLSFSGGGTRAAALAFGVLEELRATTVQWKGRSIRLLDEVDVISSISGGSFAAAYYGLRGEQAFDEFPRRFLYRPVQDELLREALSPAAWPKLAAPDYGRSDLAAEYYDREVFGGATYADLIARGRRPYVVLNATDMTSGTQFPFIQDQFDLLCSDLAGLPLARAAAASSAFPGALTPLTFRNYAGSCGYRHPRWVTLAAADHDDRANPRRTARAERRISLAAPSADDPSRPARPWLHLADGGIADNLGLRGPLDAITSVNHPWSVLQRINEKRVEKLVVIAVNAATAPSLERDQSPRVPGIVDTVIAAADVPLGNYSFDTLELLGRTADDHERDARLVAQCNRLSAARGEQCALNLPVARPFDVYAAQVSFDYLASPEERAFFKGLPTSFKLPPETIDRLREVGRRLLREDPQFRKLLADLKG